MWEERLTGHITFTYKRQSQSGSISRSALPDTSSLHAGGHGMRMAAPRVANRAPGRKLNQRKGGIGVAGLLCESVYEVDRGRSHYLFRPQRAEIVTDTVVVSAAFL